MTLKNKIKLSVIMPVFSETQSVIDIIDWLNKNVKELYEVIIIYAPKSSEESKKICAELKKQGKAVVYEQKHTPGLGWAYREGFSHVKGTHALMLDSDGEMSLNSIPKMIALIKKYNYDLVQGSRWHADGGMEGYNFLKKIYNFFYQNIFRILFKTKIHDLSLGFKMLSKKLIDEIDWEGEMHEIATETTLKPIKYGYRVSEVPAFWKKRVFGVSKNKLLNNLRYPKMAFKILFSDVKK